MEVDSSKINTFNKIQVIVVGRNAEVIQGIVRGIEAIDRDRVISIVHADTKIDETVLLLVEVLKGIIVCADNNINKDDYNNTIIYNLGNIPVIDSNKDERDNIIEYISNNCKGLIDKLKDISNKNKD